ncbi:hypothetical protein B0H16DRAFT_1730473 [Mycena metata]|uniref:DUF5648 domain-containing protein n=1 Tax=Mycena metata TaxID=1033252 RepID=A0AAD7I9R3_9AGAR|nr:hypothetical protein B0H16DRAFT_1730473 [Mycena metata]
MKHILLALLLSVTVFLTSARNTTSIDAARVAGRSAETCGNPADAVLYYTLVVTGTGEYVYFSDLTGVNTELRGGTWTLQAVEAMVFLTQEVSTVPFFRLDSTSAPEVFYTASTTELINALNNGYELVGPEVYIYPTQICGSVPFYYLRNAAKISNFYTTSESERLAFIANGYTDVEISGYVLPVGCSQCS